MNKLTQLDRRHRLFIVGLVATLMLMIVLAQRVWGDNPENPPDSIFNPLGPIADQQTVDANMVEKQSIDQREEQERLAAINGPPGEKPSNYTPPLGPPAGPARLGIFEDGPLPTGWGTQYRIGNRWGGSVNGQNTIAFAGSQADDQVYAIWNNPEQGVLIVMTYPNDPNLEPVTANYLTPTRTGAVRVTSYSGLCLTLTSTGNTTYQFNVATRQWSCNVNERPAPP